VKARRKTKHIIVFPILVHPYEIMKTREIAFRISTRKKRYESKNLRAQQQKRGMPAAMSMGRSVNRFGAAFGKFCNRGYFKALRILRHV